MAHVNFSQFWPLFSLVGAVAAARGMSLIRMFLGRF
jgi:hypothetical protein